MLEIQHDISLTHLNTLGLLSNAINYICLDELAKLKSIQAIIQRYPKFFVLGGGSNIILPEIYSGLVIHNKLSGITIDFSIDDSISITAMAGENWDNFVSYTLRYSAYGLENLSLIPGTVGASPVQNIGAYGVEVKDFIDYVTIYDIETGTINKLSNHDCQFTYRNSIFKTTSHYIVVSVTFKLFKKANLNISYGDIARQISEIQNPTAIDLRDCIIKIRQSKLPDPRLIHNAGSFFHNPILDKTEIDQLLKKYPNLPVYPTSDPAKNKISAGWLIDKLGLKGFRMGNIGVYNQQALVLVNYDSATQTELLDFAKIIQNKVFDEYQIRLNIEPIIL